MRPSTIRLSVALVLTAGTVQIYGPRERGDLGSGRQREMARRPAVRSAGYGQQMPATSSSQGLAVTILASAHNRPASSVQANHYSPASYHSFIAPMLAATVLVLVAAALAIHLASTIRRRGERTPHQVG